MDDDEVVRCVRGSACRRRRGRGAGPSRDDEDGSTLVEVLVAFTVLMVVMGAVAATLTQALEITQVTRVREVAANTAAAQVEVLRRADPADVPVGTEIFEVDTAVGTAEVHRTAEWVPADAVGEACESPTAQDRDLLRLTVEVQWPGTDVDPTRTQTVLTPDVGTFDVDRGHVGVQVVDARGTPPSPRPLVNLSGGPDDVQRTAMVSAQGCVLFDHLPPGDYEVLVQAPGIGPQGGDPKAPATVQAAATTLVTIPFDDPATVQATLTAEAGVDVPDAWLDLALRNTGLLPDPRRDVAGEGLVRVVENLFPFESGYEVWASAGACAAVDPQAVELDRPVVMPVGGATAMVDVPLTTVRIRPTTPQGNPVPGVVVDAVLPADDGCPDGLRQELGRAGADGLLAVALPPGVWSFDLPGGDVDAVDVVVADVPIDLEVQVGG